MNARPLLITDCDEVLLHMVRHFGTWLSEAHDIDFSHNGGDFSNALKRRSDGSSLTRTEMWPLLGSFFDSEMHRQTLVPYAREALAEIAEYADILILTNLEHHRNAARVEQLRSFGIEYPVITNQGGKGHPVRKILDERGLNAAIFIDDLAIHHQSVAELAPETWRLHMISEPTMAPSVPKAPAAHARIDDWRDAKSWILEKLGQGYATGLDDSAQNLSPATP